MCLESVQSGSKEKYLNIVDKLQQQGVQAVILGCTEIALLIQQSHTQAHCMIQPRFTPLLRLKGHCRLKTLGN